MGIQQHAVVAVIFSVLFFNARGQDTLSLSRKQCEAIFLEQNLLLIAEKMEVSKAEALVVQARLWPNPTVELDELNLWATPGQLAVFGEELRGFGNGKFGRNQQMSFSIEQVIATAGKRKKLVQAEQVNVEKSQQGFENLLRNLKTVFRKELTRLQYLQQSTGVYRQQLQSVSQLTHAYKTQVEQGNLPKADYVRLKALELEIAKNLNEHVKETNDTQKELKLLMRLPAHARLLLTQDGYLKNTDSLAKLALPALIDEAMASRPDLKLAKLEEQFFNNMYRYEKARRVPDLRLKGGYDRGGNFMYNFVGFGLGIDLPLFDRNQGNIQHARMGIAQSKLQYDHQQAAVENEIAVAYRNLLTSVNFYENIAPDFDQTLDNMLQAYTRNFTERNISLLEYLDFMEAYAANRKIILEAVKAIADHSEELNAAVGKDIIH